MVSMCSSKPSAPKDNSAAIAKQREAERQARIERGANSISNAFSGFNDNFYNKYQDDYVSYQRPQLEDQYEDARERLTLNLAKRGLSNSSQSIDQFDRVRSRYNDQIVDIDNRALNAANDFRSQVNNHRNALYADNRAAADPGDAASSAARVARSLQPQIPTSPLANAFADFFNNSGNAAAIYNSRKPYKNTGVQNFDATGGGSGSAQLYD